jgi:methionyl-tRNA formyltransferase
LRVAFAGTPPFAATALAALHGAGHDIALVLTRPDRPSGRGLKLTPSAVSAWAAEHGLTLEKPVSLRVPEAQQALRNSGAQVLVVAAYGLLLPAAVLGIPAQGCVNIHASLLPRWRGAAPVQRAILAGDVETGITIMRMDEGLDTGPVLLRKALPIRVTDTAGTLTEKLARLGAQAITEALDRLPELQPEAQDGTQATYAAKLGKADVRIDWGRTAEEIDRQVRAFDPSPGAETTLEGQPLKVWKALAVEGFGPPGQVLQIRNNRPVVACGKGALELLELQKPGGRRLAAADFARGSALSAGRVLGEKPLASA